MRNGRGRGGGRGEGEREEGEGICRANVKLPPTRLRVTPLMFD